MQKPTKRSLAVVTVAALALCTLGFAASQTCANTNQKTSTSGMGAKELVQTTIDQNKVVIFSKSYCPFCAKAKRALGSVIDMSKVTVLELDQRDDGSEIQGELGKKTGGTSVPRVFINQKFIGGGDDTERLKQSGELAKLVEGM